jgi:phosphatidylglycerophosphate synthase
MDRYPLAEIRTRTYKNRDAWWTVLLVDPVAVRLVRRVAPYRSITPNRLSWLAFVLGLGAAACFALVTPGWLVLGAALFHLAFVVDCMDGKVARLNGTGTAFGAWLDYMMDRVRIVTCTSALVGGQWAATGDDFWLALGGVIVFLEMFHNLNSREIARTKDGMRARLAVQHRRAGRDDETRFAEEVMTEVPAAPAGGVDVNAEFRSRYGAFVRFRNALRRSRIRPNLVSTVEYSMFCFIVAPVAGAVGGPTWLVTTVLVSSALLLAFDLLIIYKLYLTTRGFERELARATAEADVAQARQLKADTPVNA